MHLPACFSGTDGTVRNSCGRKTLKGQLYVGSTFSHWGELCSLGDPGGLSAASGELVHSGSPIYLSRQTAVLAVPVGGELPLMPTNLFIALFQLEERTLPQRASLPPPQCCLGTFRMVL